jgi:hypothetical protein
MAAPGSPKTRILKSLVQYDADLPPSIVVVAAAIWLDMELARKMHASVTSSANASLPVGVSYILAGVHAFALFGATSIGLSSICVSMKQSSVSYRPGQTTLMRIFSTARLVPSALVYPQRHVSNPMHSGWQFFAISPSRRFRIVRGNNRVM